MPVVNMQVNYWNAAYEQPETDICWSYLSQPWLTAYQLTYQPILDSHNLSCCQHRV